MALMPPREKLDVKIVRLDPTNVNHNKMVSDLMTAHWTELQKKILAGGVTPENARKIQAVKRAYNKKMDRVNTSKRDGKVLAHIAYIKGKDEWNYPANIPVGFIFSHTEITHPLKDHLDELQTQFPELVGLTREELANRVLFGEHGYVQAPYQNLRIGADLIKEHETDAQKKTQFTHRMISIWGPEAYLEAMLVKKGYQRLAVRDSGAVIMGKKLKPPKVT